MDGILTNITDTVVNGSSLGAPHILNVSFLGTRGKSSYMPLKLKEYMYLRVGLFV